MPLLFRGASSSLPQDTIDYKVNVDPHTSSQAPKQLPHLPRAGPAAQVVPCPRPRWENLLISSAKAYRSLISGMKRFPMKPNTQPSPPSEWKLLTLTDLNQSQSWYLWSLGLWLPGQRSSPPPFRSTHEHTHTSAHRYHTEKYSYIFLPPHMVPVHP